MSDKRAHAAVALAQLEGRLAMPAACECCSHGANLVYHHWSYEEEHWLDVIPLCRSCHAKVHIGALEEPRTGRIYEDKTSGQGYKQTSEAKRAVVSALWAGKKYVAFMTKARFAAEVADMLPVVVEDWMLDHGRSNESWLKLMAIVDPDTFAPVKAVRQRRLGSVQARLLTALADDTIAYRRLENHRLTRTSHVINVRWVWEGDWKAATIRSLVHRGHVKYLKTPGGNIVGAGITLDGRVALVSHNG